jgi:hypothetical protein
MRLQLQYLLLHIDDNSFDPASLVEYGNALEEITAEYARYMSEILSQ